MEPSPLTVEHALLQLLYVVLCHPLREGQRQRHQLRDAHLQVRQGQGDSS